MKKKKKTYDRFRAFRSGGDRRRRWLVFLLRASRTRVRRRATRATAAHSVTLPFLRKYLGDRGTSATRKSKRLTCLTNAENESCRMPETSPGREYFPPPCRYLFPYFADYSPFRLELKEYCCITVNTANIVIISLYERIDISTYRQLQPF